LLKQLDKAESSILCLTKESFEKNWILFVAGALAKRARTETGFVCPLLFEHKMLNFPLAAFSVIDSSKANRIYHELNLKLELAARQSALRHGGCSFCLKMPTALNDLLQACRARFT